MKTLMHLLTNDELKEVTHLPPKVAGEIADILAKDFLDVTVRDIMKLSKTSIFDVAFVDLLCTELLNRFENGKIV